MWQTFRVVDVGNGDQVRMLEPFQVMCGSLSWFSFIHLGNRRGNTIFRGALEGVLFLNLRNGSKGVLLLIQMFLIRGEGGVHLCQWLEIGRICCILDVRKTHN